MRGRKGQSTALQIVRDERPDRRNKPTAAAGPGAAEPPAHLDDAGRAKWAEMVERLAPGAVTRHRAELLAIYCESFARKLAAQGDLKEASKSVEGSGPKSGLAVTCGTGALKPHPALRVVRECEATMLRVLGDLARIDAAAPAESPQSKLSKFLPKKAP
jgi:phage terminase small subunit